MKKKIGNVGALDLTEVKAEIIEEIEGADNVGVLIFTEETEGLIAKLHIGNLGASIKVPKGCKIFQGDFELSHEYFEQNQSPSFLIEGSLRIKNDVVKEDIEKIECLYVDGFVICPQPLIVTLQAKADRIEGPIVPWTENIKLLKGKMTIDSALLQVVQKPTCFVVIGKADMTERMDSKLLNRISMMYVIGKMTIREEYYRDLQEKLSETNRAKFTIIPEGYECLSQPIFLDSTTLKPYSHAKLYTQERIRIDEDVAPEMLKKHINAIKTNSIVICKETLRETVMELCDDPHSRILFYRESLLLIEGRRTLTKAELKCQPDSFSMLVFGNLDIQDDIDPEELLRRLEYVDNFGTISANEELYGVLQTKMRTREGALVNIEQKKPEKKETSEEYLVKNTGYFKL